MMRPKRDPTVISLLLRQKQVLQVSPESRIMYEQYVKKTKNRLMDNYSQPASRRSSLRRGVSLLTPPLARQKSDLSSPSSSRRGKTRRGSLEDSNNSVASSLAGDGSVSVKGRRSPLLATPTTSTTTTPPFTRENSSLVTVSRNSNSVTGTSTNRSQRSLPVTRTSTMKSLH